MHKGQTIINREIAFLFDNDQEAPTEPFAHSFLSYKHAAPLEPGNKKHYSSGGATCL